MPREDNIIPHKFPKGKSGNQKGRPRILVSQVIVDMKKDGVEAARPTDIKTVFLMLVNCTMTELKAYVEDSKQSFLVRTIAKHMLGGKGNEILEKMLDRAMGKAAQEVQMKFEDQTTPRGFVLDGVTLTPYKPDKDTNE